MVCWKGLVFSWMLARFGFQTLFGLISIASLWCLKRTALPNVEAVVESPYGLEIESVLEIGGFRSLQSSRLACTLEGNPIYWLRKQVDNDAKTGAMQHPNENN